MIHLQNIVSAATRTATKPLSLWRQLRSTTQFVYEAMHEIHANASASMAALCTHNQQQQATQPCSPSPSPIIVEAFSGAASELFADTPSKRVQRRCVVVMSTHAHCTSMNVVAEKMQTLDALADMRVPVTLLVLDKKVHPLLYKAYRKVSKTKRYPQIFLEDADTGDNRLYIEPETFQRIVMYSLSPSHALDKLQVPIEQRASYVFQDVPKRSIGMAHVLQPRPALAPGSIKRAIEALLEEREMAKQPLGTPPSEASAEKNTPTPEEEEEEEAEKSTADARCDDVEERPVPSGRRFGVYWNRPRFVGAYEDAA